MIPRENQRGRSWVFMALTFLLASATAQAGTTGNLTGYVTGPNSAPLPGVRVTVSAPVLQGSRTATTDAQGFFRITQLPPGEGYRARFEVSGYKTTERTGIILHIDETIKLPTVRMQVQQQVEAVEVVELAPVVEQGSTTIGRTITSEFLKVVPSARTTTGVLQLAPGAATDNLGTTFRGATSPENNYVIDGLNTTGVLYGLDTSALPPEFIQEIQVKTGGYEPEYGRATGGQAIVITKSGGNEFHGDVFLYVTPIEGRRHSVVRTGDVPGNNEKPSPNAAYLVSNEHQSMLAQVGFDLGGYIIKDKLWFFAGYAPEVRRRVWGHEFRDRATLEADANFEDPDISENAIYDKQDRLVHYYIANFTFNISQDHSVRLSANGNPRKVTGVQAVAFGGDPSTYMGLNTGGAMDYSLNYNGKFAGGLVNLDAILGYHTESDYVTPLTADEEYNSFSGDSAFNGTPGTGEEAVVVHRYLYDVPGGCSDPSDAACQYTLYRTGGFGGMNRTAASRFAFKPVLSVFLNNVVGNHVLKLGGDMERNHVINQRAFTGGALVDELRRRNSSITDPADPNYYYFIYRERYYSNFGEPVEWSGLDSDSSYFYTDTHTINYSAFVQDSWSLLSNLSLSLGIRWESQSIRDIQGVSRISLNDNIAPRLGVIYDFTKEGKSKLFANFGRYYESIPQDINDRALSAEGFNYYCFSTLEFPNYVTGAQPLTDDYACFGAGSNLGGEVTPVQANLKGQYSDQYLVGFEYEVANNLSAGVTAIYASLGNVIEDISPNDGATYLIANPGSDNFDYYVTELDENGDLTDPELAGETFRQCIASVDPLTGAPQTYCFPKATRFYRALELNMNKRFSNNWTALGSYTFSQTYGNYPGLFAQSRGQLDPNITSQFDIPSLIVNRYGYLDTDRRHLIKFSGAYQFNFGTSLGLTAAVQSGIPILYLGAHPIYSAGEAFVIPRASRPTDAPADVDYRTPWVVQLDVNARHEFTFANKQTLAVGVQANNLLNAQTTLTVDQNWTRDYAVPASGGTSLSQVQCFDQSGFYAKASCDVEPNYGNPTSFQTPFSLRFEVKYSF